MALSHPTPSPIAAGHAVGSQLRLLATSTAVATYLLVVLGSTVRVTESGMGCPGWPLCYGALGPIDRFHALLEQSHRYLAAVVTLLVAATAISAVRQWRGRSGVATSALLACGVIVLQIALGAVTVLTHNAPPTVAAHLVTGFFLLMVVTATATASWVPRREARGRRLSPLGWWASAATLGQVLLGSLLVDGGASRSCPSWPLCPTAGIPAPLVGLQLLHRSGALLAGGLMVAFAVHAWRRWAGSGVHFWSAMLAGSLLVTAVMGAASAILLAPAYLQDLHLAVAAAVLVSVVALATIGWRRAADNPLAELPPT